MPAARLSDGVLHRAPVAAPPRSVLLLAVILPFWISFLLRVYAWIGLLNNKGVINHLLMSAGRHRSTAAAALQQLRRLSRHRLFVPAVHDPAAVRESRAARTWTLLDAAADLGARRWQVFLDVTLPLSMPGIIGGCLLVFIPAVGEFTIPALLGGADTLMIGRVLWDEFFISRDWPVASAVSVVLLLLLIAPIMWFQHHQNREQEARAMKRRSRLLLTIVALRLRAPVRADPVGGDLLVQRIRAW